MDQPQLAPRDGKGIPKKEHLTPEQKRVMDEIDEITKSQSAALAVLAQAQAATQVATEDAADRLQSIMDMLVKCMQHFSIPLPELIKKEMTDKAYDPDALGPPEEDEDDEDDEEATP